MLHRCSNAERQSNQAWGVLSPSRGFIPISTATRWLNKTNIGLRIKDNLEVLFLRFVFTAALHLRFMPGKMLIGVRLTVPGLTMRLGLFPFDLSLKEYGWGCYFGIHLRSDPAYCIYSR